MNQYIFLFLSIFLIVSCDNDIDLVDTYKDIPIVYGIISSQDTAQYIRVEKGFIDPSISALDIAQNPDSLYYENATVSIKLSSNDQIYQLERVNGNLEGYVRDDGIFAQDPNYLYKIKSNSFPIVIGDTLEFQLKRNENLPLVTAKTTIIDQPRIQLPGSAGVINLNYSQPTRFSWRVGEGNAIFDLALRINYKERNSVVGGEFENLSLLWQVTKNIEITESNQSLVEYELDGIDFYGTLASRLEVNPDIVRKFLSIDVIVTAGGQEISDYITIGQANLGITSSQDIPTFTNLSVGRGIFSASNQFENSGMDIAPRSLDSLFNSQLTAALNFTP